MALDYRTCPNLVKLFFDQAAALHDKPFLWAKRDGKWTAQSWTETAAEVTRLARGLVALGLKPGPQVGALLEAVERWWIAGDFSADRTACLAELKRLAHTA